MLALPFLAGPADVTIQPESEQAATSYAGPVALAYVIPMSVTVTSIGLFYATRHSDHIAGGFAYGAGLGLLGGVVAPPTVHLFHGNLGNGIASLGGSLFFTAAGGFLGLAITSDSWADREQNDDSVPNAIAGFAAGAVVLQGLWGLIDANELAEARRTTKPLERTVALAVPLENGAMLGIRGAF